MGRKTTLWTFSTTNKQHLRREKPDLTNKRKLLERKRISPNSSTTNAIRTNQTKVSIDRTQ